MISQVLPSIIKKLQNDPEGEAKKAMQDIVVMPNCSAAIQDVLFATFVNISDNKDHNDGLKVLEFIKNIYFDISNTMYGDITHDSNNLLENKYLNLSYVDTKFILESLGRKFFTLNASDKSIGPQSGYIQGVQGSVDELFLAKLASKDLISYNKNMLLYEDHKGNLEKYLCCRALELNEQDVRKLMGDDFINIYIEIQYLDFLRQAISKKTYFINDYESKLSKFIAAQSVLEESITKYSGKDIPKDECETISKSLAEINKFLRKENHISVKKERTGFISKTNNYKLNLDFKLMEKQLKEKGMELKDIIKSTKESIKESRDRLKREIKIKNNVSQEIINNNEQNQQQIINTESPNHDLKEIKTENNKFQNPL
jgi:hypothetical protein